MKKLVLAVMAVTTFFSIGAINQSSEKLAAKDIKEAHVMYLDHGETI
ncbi:hypothetical protein P9Z80_24180 [Bacillus cereus]|nr:hypothetical protein [Bacillus cereus]MEC3260710.1 hypothetical protein [Bacillus cereus]